MKIVMSSGHGKYIRGAAGPAPWGIDEVDEARRVVERVAGELERSGVSVTTFHDDTSTTQDQNLKRIVSFHNSQPTHDLDVSVHFNAYQVTTSKAMGCECWYYSQKNLAADISGQMADATSLPDRGPKKSTSLYFLKHTKAPSVLLEVCFVDAKMDCDAYRSSFDELCAGIAVAISGQTTTEPIPPTPPKDEVLFQTKGKMSTFGGPEDDGVAPDEGLAFIYKVDEAPQLFLPGQPPNTTGLARRLNPYVKYVACRWDYSVTPKDMLRDGTCLVRAKGIELKAFCADWGPHKDTKRVADLSPGLADDLGLKTDDEVEIIFPAPT